MDNKSWQWFGGGFAAGVVIIGFIWIGMSNHTAKVAVYTQGSATSSDVVASTTPATKSAKTSDSAVVVTETTPTASGETVSAMDQSAGTTAHVASVTVTHTTWIAIKDINGRILGAHRIDASGENIPVSLLRAMAPGHTYQAVLYVDNGDKAFNVHTDTLVVGSEGAPVASTFRAQ